ncbi:MAG: peptide deformylase [Bacillota bacterium]
MMTELFIKKIGDPLLRQVCSPVEDPASVRCLLAEMAGLLRTTSTGVGLAAPQVGSLLRVVVIKLGRELIELVNPRITARQGRQRGRETCLSLPGINGIVTRARRVTVEAADRAGEALSINASGFLARCIQHELDHLDGILFIDHVQPGEAYDCHTNKPLDVASLLAISRPPSN